MAKAYIRGYTGYKKMINESAGEGRAAGVRGRRKGQFYPGGPENKDLLAQERWRKGMAYRWSKGSFNKDKLKGMTEL